MEMASGEKTLALGVVTFENAPAALAHLHKSIVGASRKLRAGLSLVLHVVDNGKPSEWPEGPIPLVRLPSQGNTGFARAMNAPMEKAFSDPRCDFFVCLNPDGVLHANALAELVATAERFPESLVEARQFPEEHPKPYDPETLETPWASGACLLVPRRIHEALRGFDPGFFLYCEDVDLSWRARAAKFSVRVAPGALFGHRVLGRAPDPATERLHLLSARRLGRKWGSARFARWAENELLRRGLFPSREALPAVGELPAVSGAEVADFSHGLTFAEARWAP